MQVQQARLRELVDENQRLQAAAEEAAAEAGAAAEAAAAAGAAGGTGGGEEAAAASSSSQDLEFELQHSRAQVRSRRGRIEFAEAQWECSNGGRCSVPYAGLGFAFHVPQQWHAA